MHIHSRYQVVDLSFSSQLDTDESTHLYSLPLDLWENYEKLLLNVLNLDPRPQKVDCGGGGWLLIQGHCAGLGGRLRKRALTSLLKTTSTLE